MAKRAEEILDDPLLAGRFAEQEFCLLLPFNRHARGAPLPRMKSVTLQKLEPKIQKYRNSRGGVTR
jgi:hypothetical protein